MKDAEPLFDRCRSFGPILTRYDEIMKWEKFAKVVGG